MIELEEDDAIEYLDETKFAMGGVKQLLTGTVVDVLLAKEGKAALIFSVTERGDHRIDHVWATDPRIRKVESASA